MHRGEPGDPAGWSVGWLAQDRLVALLAVDRPRDLAQARRRIGLPVDPQRLADVGVAVKDA